MDSTPPISKDWDWADRGTPHVSFAKDEPLPFQEGRVLGHGVNGPVCETTIKGVRLALKRKFCRYKVGQRDLQEIAIIRKLQHKHIIQLAGSYTRGPYLGILLYPVATCDMATFLEDIDFMQSHEPSSWRAEIISEYQERRARCGEISRSHLLGDDISIERLEIAARARLWESYGCIASAMAYLHSNSIRHKDLKPLNILLARDGLWITDFGHSSDFSDYSDSATNGGERGTLKYCAPEVAAYERSGRAADIFSLGCVFFEMAALRHYSLEEIKELRPAMDRSFHNNLHTIFEALGAHGRTDLDDLPLGIARSMMCKNPADRPTIEDVVHHIGWVQAMSAIELETFSGLQCRHLSIPAPTMYSYDQELVITIGNTFHECRGEHIAVEGEERNQFPIVAFVECFPADYLECVIFLHSPSSRKPLTMCFEPQFARRSTIWGTYTLAVLLVFKPGHYVDSPLASQVPWPGSEPRAALPMTWDLQVDEPYASKAGRVRVRSVRPQR